MKKLMVLLSFFFVFSLSFTGSAESAATTWGINFEFSDDAGDPIGSAMITFDAVTFNEWHDFSRLTGVDISGAISYLGVNDKIAGFNFSAEPTLPVGSFIISDAEPWYPIDFADSTYWFIGDQISFGPEYKSVFDGDLSGESFEHTMYDDGGTRWYTATYGGIEASMWFDDPVPAAVPVPASALLLISALPILHLMKRGRA